MKSQHSAISRPPPKAWPFTAAMTGSGSSISAMNARSKISCCARHTVSVMPSRSLRSAPAQNARSPAPVSTTQRVLPGSAVRRVHRSMLVLAHLRVERVQHLRAIERDQQDVLALLPSRERLVVHRGILIG